MKQQLLFMALIVSLCSNAQYGFPPSEELKQKTDELQAKTQASTAVVFGDAYQFTCWDPSLTTALEKNSFPAKDCEPLASLSFTDQVKVFKSVLADKRNDYLRQMTINRVYTEVFGPYPTVDEFAYWDQILTSGTTHWYANMVVENVQFLNIHPDYRTEAIKLVYRNVFGREPTADDLKYWMPRKKNYHLMYNSNLGYLYSANGVDELTKTVKRAFTKKKPNHTDDEVKQMLVQARGNKYDFNRMVTVIH